MHRQILSSNGHDDVVGLDLGILRLATVSSGEIIQGTGALRSSLQRLRRQQRTVSRRLKGSNRRRRAISRVARTHRRVRNVRRDGLHKLTTHLAKSHGRVVIEDLNARGMMGSARGTLERPGRKVRAKAGLNRALADASLGEFRRQLEYKCGWYGAELVVAPRFFASSKRCSGCGQVREKLSLAERVFVCPACGQMLDRDLNAAHNLVWWAAENAHLVAASPGVPTKPASWGGRAAETENARGGDARPGLSRADLVEARTGNVPEPAGLTGGPRRGVPYVP